MKALHLILGAAALLSACHAAKPEPIPVVRTQIVKEPVSVPCPALEQLGSEPVYADTDAALAAAVGLDNRVVLLLTGRSQRQNRLAEYIGAKTLCHTPN